MATFKLTDGQVEALQSGDRDTYAWDSALPRFGIRLTPAGARIYLVQYRAKGAPGQKGKTRRITIGHHDGELWNVTKARAAARKLLAPVDLGRDPFAEREAEREATHQAAIAAQALRAAEAQQAERQSQETYGAILDRYTRLRGRPTRAWEETERLLRFGAAKAEPTAKRGSGRPFASDTDGPMKAWASTHIAEIRRSDVASLIDAIGERSPAVARATYAALRPFFDWCVERDLIAHSPCDKLTAPPRPTARDRVLSDDELRLVWRASAGLGFPFGPVVQLLALTGQRRSEVAGMTWDELDLDGARWRIPAVRTKNGQAHEVDLSPQALAILAEIPKLGPHVFPARGGGAVRGFSATKRKLDSDIEALRQLDAAKAGEPPPKAPLADWRIHDLRRTAATGMAALGFPPHVVERVLNHVSGTQSGLVGVYQRHDYRPERKAAVTAWGAEVAGLVSGAVLPSNVRKLRG